MIFVEPSPCGLFVFGSALLIRGERILLLNARREIPQQHSLARLDVVLEGLAGEVIAHLMIMAAQCGLCQQEIADLLEDAPDFHLVRKRAS